MLFALTLDPSPGGRGKCMPFSLREKGWDEGMFVSNFARLNRYSLAAHAAFRVFFLINSVVRAMPFSIVSFEAA